jgi:putative ABC transport system ATP-binding protein
VAEQAGHVMAEVYGRPPGGTPLGSRHCGQADIAPRSRADSLRRVTTAGRKFIVAATTVPPPPPPPPTAAPARVAARAVHATKVYGMGDTQVVALDDVTVDFGEGEFTAIMGPSGSGKSTLMHCIAGLDVLSAGQVFLGDTDLSRLTQKQLTLLRREQVGFVFQAFNLVPTLNAKENITLPLDLAGKKPDSEWFDRVIDTVGLRDRLKHKPSELSGGQQQRVAVARALASRPHIIFADEPTGNLDSHAGGEILDFMRTAVDEFGQTIVMVTHDAGAASKADRVVFLVDGRTVDEMRQPTPDRVLDEIKRLGGA